MLNTRFILIFLGASALLFAFFYFYPAAIFESTVEGIGGSINIDLSLRTILFGDHLPAELNTENITSIRPTLIGGLMMFICIFGLPLMIAYRTTIKKPASNEAE